MTNKSPEKLSLIRFFSFFLPFTFVFCLVTIAQAQTDFSFDELKTLKNRKVNPDIFKYNLPQDRFPMPEITKQSNSILADGDLDPAFNVSVTEGFGYVNKTVVQTDGKIIAVGLFQRANGVRTNGIARFNADGSLDTNFTLGAGANAAIRTVALQSDGKIIVGGAFTSFNGQTASRIIRLNTNGTTDATFNFPTTLNGQVNDVLVLPNGKIMVGGAFVVSSTRLLRLNSSGTLDSAISGFNAPVYVIVNAPDNKILVGGEFSFPEASITRLNNDGTVDTTFNPTTGGEGYPIYKIAVQPNGKILASGIFPFFNGIATDSVVRLNNDGTVDSTFEITNNPNVFDLNISGLAIQPDGKILIGYFNDGYTALADVRRFNADASPDLTFNTNTGNSLTVTDLNLLGDGNILVAGYFDTLSNQPHLRLAKLNSNGSVDHSFNASASSFGTVFAIKRQPDGKIIIGGDFEYVNGVAKRAVARLNADGTVDNSFTVAQGILGDVYSLVIQPDGKIIIGGLFGGDNNFPAYAAARLNANGSFDISLDNQNSFVFVTFDVVLQPDNKILLGGQITNLSSNLVAASRLNANGSSDSSFTPATIQNGTIRALSVQPNGKIIIGGTFFSQPSFQRAGLARLNGNGSLDSTIFGGNANVASIKQLTDGSIYAGGSTVTRHSSEGTLDTTLNTGSGFNSQIRALEIQRDGKIVLGGFFTTYNGNTVNRLIRINNTGTLDTTFNTGLGPSGTIFALDLQTDGKILAGGQFLGFNGAEKISLVRLNNTAPRNNTFFDYDGDGRADISVFRPSNGVWYLNNSSNGFSATSFGVSTDKIVPADFDGDGKTDISIFRDGIWYRLNSSNGTFSVVSFGQVGDIPIAGDFDGDGKFDQAVYRGGVWYLNRSTQGFAAISLGVASDKTVAADYDGDGKTDVAVFRDGTWYYLRSSDNGFVAVSFGISNDVPVAADYDGDGKADQAVYRNGTWYILQSQNGFTSVTFGIATDTPVPADYDGDGKADVAVFRNGVWYLLQTTAGFSGQTFGTTDDKPTPSAYIP